MLGSVTAGTTCLFVVSFIVLYYVNSIQNGPYMDEIFHIPQAQAFCAKNFSHWDPMITTLPGLYISSFILLFLPWMIFGREGFDSFCTTQNLRATNLVYCCGNFIVLMSLSRILYLKAQNRRGPACHLVLNALTISLFPVLFFFSWLYYTDPGAVFFTLLMYLLCLRGNHTLASASGIISILFRQTNVIWVLFCLGVNASDILEQRVKKKKDIRRQFPSMTDWQVLKSMLNLLFSGGLQNMFSIVKDILISSGNYMFVLFGFVVFVYVNNGIVVGDRSNHQASFNFPQVFYFLAVSTAFAFIHACHPKHILNCVKAILRNPVKCMMFVAVSYLMIKNFTYEHKYTLSDNRHYTFYVWSKLFKRFTWSRYAMIPVYLLSLVNLFLLTIHKGFLWRVCVCLCIVLCLVPQALLEFRYYIIPYCILRLNMNLPSKKVLFLEMLTYVAINGFTVYMFTQKPFYWPNDPSPQRFMW